VCFAPAIEWEVISTQDIVAINMTKVIFLMTLVSIKIPSDRVSFFVYTTFTNISVFANFLERLRNENSLPFDS
jgi:hypothetical protein